jgi:hypothetical protein
VATPPPPPPLPAREREREKHRWGDSGRFYTEAELVAVRGFVLRQLAAAVSSGHILTSTGKISRSKTSFATVLDDRGAEAAKAGGV